MDRPILSVIIPAYNEAATIDAVLDAVLDAPYPKQVIVVDDGSTDGTAQILDDWRGRRPNERTPGRNAEVVVIHHPRNRGKGAAIRTGFASARCPITIIQDADLEYDPADYHRLVAPILAGEAEVVYGSRYADPASPLPWTSNRLCVCALNLMVRILFGQKLTDEATCYKAFRTDLLRQIDLRCERFEFCPEVTAKVCRSGVMIHEVPIRYAPRTHQEGKKIRWWDGVEAIATLIRWRVAPAHWVEHAVPEPCDGIKTAP